MKITAKLLVRKNTLSEKNLGFATNLFSVSAVGRGEELLDQRRLLRHQLQRGQADPLLQDHALRHLRPLRVQERQAACLNSGLQSLNSE